MDYAPELTIIAAISASLWLHVCVCVRKFAHRVTDGQHPKVKQRQCVQHMAVYTARHAFLRAHNISYNVQFAIRVNAPAIFRVFFDFYTWSWFRCDGQATSGIRISLNCHQILRFRGKMATWTRSSIMRETYAVVDMHVNHGSCAKTKAKVIDRWDLFEFGH